MSGLTMREGMTLRIRIPTSWRMPTFTPDARAEMNKPSGTKVKKRIKKMIATMIMMIGPKNSIITS